MDADYTNSLLLRVGEVQHFSLKAEEQVMFRFMVDEREDITIQQTMINGYVASYVQFDPTSDDYIEALEGTKMVTIDTKSANFHTEQMYYMLVIPNSDAEFTV